MPAIRPARPEGQETIISYPGEDQPRNLHWENFLVAEENDRSIGIRQVKAHNGTREVASGFVLPEYRRQRISAQRMDDFRAEYRLARIIPSLFSLYSPEKVRIVPMKRG